MFGVRGQHPLMMDTGDEKGLIVPLDKYGIKKDSFPDVDQYFKFMLRTGNAMLLLDGLVLSRLPALRQRLN